MSGVAGPRGRPVLQGWLLAHAVVQRAWLVRTPRGIQTAPIMASGRPVVASALPGSDATPGGAVIATKASPICHAHYLTSFSITRPGASGVQLRRVT
jgi:hypothetical protein